MDEDEREETKMGGCTRDLELREFIFFEISCGIQNYFFLSSHFPVVGIEDSVYFVSLSRVTAGLGGEMLGAGLYA